MIWFPVFVFAATANHRGDPVLDMYGPFDSRDAAESFRDRLSEHHLQEHMRRSDVCLSDELMPQDPDDHWINDPEYQEQA